MSELRVIGLTTRKDGEKDGLKDNSNDRSSQLSDVNILN